MSLKVFCRVALLALCSVPAHSQWTQFNGPGGGDVMELRRDLTNSKMYAIVNYELYVAPTGEGWTHIPTPAGFQVYSVLPEGNNLTVVVFNGTLFSSDGGATWTRKHETISEAFGKIEKLPVGNIFLMHGYDGIKISLDGGTIWKKIFIPTQPTNLLNVQFTTDGDIFTVDALSGIRKYSKPADHTNLANWDPSAWVTVFPRAIANPSFNPYVVSFGAVVSGTDKIFVSERDEPNAKTVFFSSVDKGATWQPVPMTGYAGNQNIMQPQFSPGPNGKIYIFDNDNNNKALEYTDGAPTPWATKVWPTIIRADQSVRTIAWRNNDVFAGGTEDGVFKSGNFGNSWAQITDGMNVGNGEQIAVSANGRMFVVQGHSPAGYYYSTSSDGLSWLYKTMPENITQLIKLPDNTLFMSTVYRTYSSSDAGDNWVQNPMTSSIGAFVVVAANDIYGFDGSGNAHETIDKGQTWTPIPITGLPPVYSPKVATRDADGFFYVLLTDYATNKMEYWKLNSNGSPWTATKLAVPFDPSVANSAVLYSTSNKVYTTASDFTYVTTDKGVSWKTIDVRGLLIPMAGGAGFSTEGNLAVTQDEGKTVRNIPLPTSKAILKQITTAPGGDVVVGAANNSPALKYSGNLILPAAALPLYVDHGWQQLPGGPFGGEADRVWTNSAGNIFARVYYSLYRYIPATSKWDKLQVGTLGALAIDAANKVYVLNQRGELHTSTDNGATFAKISTVTFSGMGVAPKEIIKSQTGDLIVTSSNGPTNGLFRSTDSGLTFARIATEAHDKLAMSSNGTLLATYGSGQFSQLKRSTDGGATWSPTSAGLPAGNISCFSVIAGESTSLVVLTSAGPYRSTDDGASWVSMKGDLPNAFYSDGDQIHMSPTNEYFLVSGYQQGIYVSSTQGVTWTKRSTEKDQNFLAWSGSEVVAALFGGISKSSDNGATFSPMTKAGLTGLYYSDIVLSKGKLVVLEGLQQQVFVSTDMGQNFVQATTGLFSVRGLLHTPADDVVYAYGSTGIAKSTDGGGTWTMVTTVGNVERMTTGDGLKFFIAMSGSADIRFSTNLTTWTALPAAGLPININAAAIVASADGNTLYFSNNMNGDVYQIAFGVATKIDIIKDARALAVNGSRVYALSYDGNLYEKNGTAAWVRKTVPRGSKIKIDPLGNIYIFLDGANIWVSRDAGLIWQNVGLPASSFFTTSFQDIFVDEYTGLAHAMVIGRGAMKSSGIVFPDDHTAPAKTAVSPATGATDISATTTLTITFNEATFPVAGPKVRIFKSGNPTAVQELLVTAGVRVNKTFTFTLPTRLDYSSLHYVIVDNGAFKDIFGNFYGGISSTNEWSFTTIKTPDTTAPTFTLQDASNLNRESIPAKFVVDVTDEAIALTKTKFFYKELTSTGAFIEKQLTPPSGATVSSARFEAEVSSAMDYGIGIAFYFEAEDATGNKGRYPAGTGYAYSYFRYPAASPQNIPAPPVGGLQEGYRIISVPFTLADKTVATLFREELGDPNPALWRLLTYDKGTLLEYPNEQFMTFERGKGYWINVKESKTLSLEGASVPANNPTNFFTMRLEPKWNQVGNPYTVPISWNDVRAQNSNIGPLKKYTGAAGYVNIEDVPIFEGGFVYVNGTSPIDVKVRFKGFTTGGRTEEITLGKDISEESWELPIVIRQGEFSSAFSGIGMHPQAKTTFDNFDDLNPPPFPRKLELSFEHPESSPKRLAKDIVPTRDDYTWEFFAETSETDDAELTWDNTALGDNSKEVFLFDGEKQTVINMRDQNNYKFTPGRKYRFKVFFGENLLEKIKPDRVFAGSPYPNPTTATTTIPFTLSDQKSDYLVRVEILDVTGRPVTTVANGRYSPGFYGTMWDASQDNTPRGLYIYRLHVSDGATTETFTGKIVLK